MFRSIAASLFGAMVVALLCSACEQSKPCGGSDCTGPDAETPLRDKIHL